MRHRFSDYRALSHKTMTALSRILLIGLILFIGLGCPAETPPAVDETPAAAVLTAGVESGKSTPVDDQLAPDPKMTELIRPYREEMAAAMNDEVGTAAAPFERGWPESTLGNLVADALLWHARSTFGETVQMSIMNNGGIRLPSIPAGPITIGDIYQLVPFDNRVVVLTLTGNQVESLLATTGGEPIAGFSYVTSEDGTETSDIRVAGEPLVADQNYRIATVDYLASIGGRFKILQEASERQDDTIYLRDAVIGYLRERQTITPTLDGRISHVSEP